MTDEFLPITGGCQCGAVRYDITAQPKWSQTCHCRMCQRASGGPFIAVAGVMNEALTWHGDTPGIFNSSTIAERGFCSKCGTPLFYRPQGGKATNIMICTMDDPNQIAPKRSYGKESAPDWLSGLSELPHQTIAEAMPKELLEKITSKQYTPPKV